MISSIDNANKIFVTGTDTGIGKTVVSLLLMRHFFEKGRTPFYLKPFQTGCQTPYAPDSDAAFIHENVSQLKDKDPADSVLFCFAQPKAPLFAAGDARKTIDVSLVARAISEKAARHDPLIIEGAGGLHVPVTEKLLMIDLIEMTGAGVVLAARTGLGTINHTLLSIESLIKRGLCPLMILFVDSGPIKTPPEMLRENMMAVKMFSGIGALGYVAKVRDFDRLALVMNY